MNNAAEIHDILIVCTVQNNSPNSETLTNNSKQPVCRKDGCVGINYIDKAFDYGVKIELTMGAPDWALTGTHNWVLNTIGQVIDFVDDLNLVP